MSNFLSGSGGRATSSPARSETQQVSIGPVARQLSIRRPRRRNWLPKAALAICTIACGFIVQAAVQNSQVWLGQDFVGGSRSQPSVVVNSQSHNFGAQVDSQVRSVIELLGAFEQLENQDPKNPLAWAEDSSTSPVAFYAPPEGTAEETAKFLGDISMPNADVGAKFADEPDDAATGSDDVPGPAHVELQGAVPLELKPQPVNDVVRQRSVEPRISLEPPVELAPAADTPLPNIAKATEYESAANQHLPTPRSNEPRRELARPLAELAHGQEPSATVQKDAEEVRLAAADYDRELLALENAEPQDLQASRRFYAALAELSQATWVHQRTLGQERISELYEHPQLFELTSSAASSWIDWSKRRSPGIVVAGKIQTVSEHQDGYLVGVQTTDRKSSVLQVFVKNVDFGLQSAENAVFFGIVVARPGSIEPLIMAEFSRPLR